jgi:hypothetical protein
LHAKFEFKEAKTMIRIQFLQLIKLKFGKGRYVDPKYVYELEGIKYAVNAVYQTETEPCQECVETYFHRLCQQLSDLKQLFDEDKISKGIVLILVGDDEDPSTEAMWQITHKMQFRIVYDLFNCALMTADTLIKRREAIAKVQNSLNVN